MVFQCCVRGCRTIAKNGLHSFPSNKLMASKWILAIKAFHLIDHMNANKLSHSFHKVCKKHFNDSDFQSNIDDKSQLVRNSVPTLFLPEDTANSKAVDSSVKFKSLKRLQPRHSKRSNSNEMGALKQSKDVLQHKSNVEVVVNDSVNQVQGCGNAGVEILPENIERSGRHRKITIQSNVNPKLALTLSYYQKKVRELKQKLKGSKINDVQVINYLSNKFNKQQLQFLKMQLTNCRRTKHGRRYELEQKSFCLAMYKQGPKNYRFMEQFFALPTKKTLMRHSAHLLFKTGVDPNVLESIKETVKDWPQNDRYCTISWDEVSLKEHLEYCQTRDIIEGFVELEKTRFPVFATHSLTFMVRGINVAFKQAVGYFYTHGLKAFELAGLVQLMIEAVSTTGLHVILSVCDQAGTNASSVNTLINPVHPSRVQGGQLLVYKINGRKIIHCFDPSHLIKTTRNNLQKKDLVHFISKRWRIDDADDIGEADNIDEVDNIDSPQIASWDDILELYRMDSRSSQRCLPKLTDEHLKPNKLKMKVSLATQIFSNTCGRVMLRCIQQKKLPDHFAGTAPVLFFMNDLFDSVNGSEHQQDNTLKSAVEANSIHFAFWKYALSTLRKMYYVDKLTAEVNNRSSVLKKFESTIRGYMEFSKLCFTLNIPKVSIRYPVVKYFVLLRIIAFNWKLG